MQAKRLNIPGFFKQSLTFYEESTSDSLIIPVGILPEVVRYLNHDIIDERFEHPTLIDIQFSGDLRPYQTEVVDNLQTKTIGVVCATTGSGVVCATTGSGKTIMIINLICQRRQPTLVLVHNKTLLEQFKTRLLQFTNLKLDDIGIIGGGVCKFGDVTIATLQSMHRLSPELLNEVNKKFGQVFCDEVHVIAANTFYNVMNKLKAKYKYGFSATPQRTDGLDEVIHFAAGPLIHTVKDETLQNFIVKPTAEYIYTDFDYPLFDVSEYQYMITTLAEDEERNQLIIDTVTSPQNATYQKALLCGRVDQAKYLVKKLGKNVDLLIGTSKKDHRKKIVEKLVLGELQTVVSTYQCFGTGTDIPGLEMIVMCSPIKSHILVKQCAGRLSRLKANKKSPRIIVFIDKKVPILQRQSYSVKKTLKNL